jgi:hypothetical protein
LNRLADFNEIWYGGNAIQGYLDAVTFNAISSTILKWLWFRVVGWRHDFQPCKQWFGIVSLFLGYYGYITYNLLANVTC